jgi:hypothetical protein
VQKHTELEVYRYGGTRTRSLRQLVYAALFGRDCLGALITIHAAGIDHLQLFSPVGWHTAWRLCRVQ